MRETRSCGLENARRLGDLVGAIGRELSAAGIDTARLDARLLIAHATARTAGDVVLQPDADVSADALATLERLVARRKAREPMSQILGTRGFYDLAFKVTPDVLTPRPDTEILVDTVLDEVAAASLEAPAILDLGTGTGCLVLTLLQALPSAAGIATDISAAALAVAAENAHANGLMDRVLFVEGTWFDALARGEGPFDIIVSNPPYIPSGDIDGLDPEVRDHEPRLALDGGDDGLDAYRVIVGGARENLKAGGILALEVGIGQARAVAAMLEAAGFGSVGVVPDLGGIERVVRGIAP